MNPEAQRIAIAEARGKRLEVYQDEPSRDAEERTRALPDYLSDLNAMHEAWIACIKHKILPWGLPAQSVWRENLKLICLRDEATVGFNSTSNATAAQRAEAFLRTLNLWTDD
jgi:hypothetical protein